MGYRGDIYSSPEKYDLEPLHMLEDDTLSYAFDMLYVWLHKPSGLLYWATDAGCSCPSPFEDYTELKDLGEPITAANFAEFEEAVKTFATGYRNDEINVPETEKAAVLHDVKTRLGIYV